MNVELAPAILSLGLIVLGLSFLLQTQQWIKLMRSIFQQPERYFLGAMVELVFGLWLALSYHRWDATWPIFTTAFGWLMALEGTIFLLAPAQFQRFNGLSDGAFRLYLRIGGPFLLLLGVLLGRFVLTVDFSG